VRQVFETMLPQDEIDRLCQQCGVIERQRKLDLGMLVRAIFISAGTPGRTYQADVLRSYLEFEVPRVARSAFYWWFNDYGRSREAMQGLERFFQVYNKQAPHQALGYHTPATGYFGP
jgi:hypothetical protein